MTCRRFGKRGRVAYLSGNLGFLVDVSIGTVLFHHLVVDSQQKERSGPLAKEQGMMVSVVDLEKQRPDDRGNGRAQEKAGGQFGGVALHHGCGLIFRYLSGAYAIIHGLNLLKICLIGWESKASAKDAPPKASFPAIFHEFNRVKGNASF